MSEKSHLIDKLKTNKKSRMAYVRAHLSVIIPSQIRALRRRRNDMKQKDLAREAGMAQPRIAVMERPGATNFNVETLVRLAAAFKVGIIVKFVPFSEMLKWENGFSQDAFDATAIDEDVEFQGETKKEEGVKLVATTEQVTTPRAVARIPFSIPNLSEGEPPVSVIQRGNVYNAPIELQA